VRDELPKLAALQRARARKRKGSLRYQRLSRDETGFSSTACLLRTGEEKPLPKGKGQGQSGLASLDRHVILMLPSASHSMQKCRLMAFDLALLASLHLRMTLVQGNVNPLGRCPFRVGFVTRIA